MTTFYLEMHNIKHIYQKSVYWKGFPKKSAHCFVAFSGIRLFCKKCIQSENFSFFIMREVIRGTLKKIIFILDTLLIPVLSQKIKNNDWENDHMNALNGKVFITSAFEVIPSLSEFFKSFIM